MATVPLPQQPNLEQLRKQARDLQRAVRSGHAPSLALLGFTQAEPSYPLSRAQLAVSRRYGFASWARLRHHVEAINTRTWVLTEPAADESPADQLLRLACLNYEHDGPAQRAEAVVDATRMLDRYPDLASSSLAVAATLADVHQVRRHLAANHLSATAPTGPYRWTPLMYVAYARLDVDLDQSVETVRLLLQAGADPNDGRFFLGLPTPFTVLTGLFGGGEMDQPVHPHSIPLARLLLSAGADPNDGQALYNRMFNAEDDFLELLFEFGLGRGDGGPWRQLLPDLLDAPATMVRRLLRWAVTHDQRERVALLARNGTDVVRPFRDGATPIQVAFGNGLGDMVDQLTDLGASTPTLSPVDAFIAAALAGDASAVHTTPREVIDAARNKRPALAVWAAGQERVDAVELLVAAGFDVNAYGRGDVPIEQEWQTALHSAVERGNTRLAQRLLDLGADKTLRDRRFDGTPADWAEHLGRAELAQLLND